jgi:hypothetical protein
MLSQIALLAPLLLTLFGRSNGNSLGEDVVLALGLSAFFVVASGYFATTAILSVVLRGRPIWIYPLVAAVFFMGHEQVFFKGRHAPDASDLKIQIAGGGVVFASAFFGNWLARRWK